MIKNKFNAQRVVCDGMHFHSKKECRIYNELKLMQQAGEIDYFLRQVPFHLPGNVKFLCDYAIFSKGNVSYKDAKGVKTPMYILKKKQVEALYPVKIIEI